MNILGYITHPDCLLHDMGHLHPEQPLRIKVIEKAILRENFSNTKKYLAPLATKEQLLLAHDKNYIDFIFNQAPKEGLTALDPDTSMNMYTLSAALRAAGAVIMAVDLVMKGEVKLAFCNVRPPGHHAERNKAMGFCFFNNVAIGAFYAMQHYQLNRITIIDFDVHHGNGTEDIIKNDERILLCSSFQHPFYPFSGSQTHSTHIINIPLAAGSTGKELKEQVQSKWFDAIRQFQPQIILISAGFDAYVQDDMSELSFAEEDYAWISLEIKKIANELCDGKIISVLEGGYHLEGLSRCVIAHLNGLTL